MKNKEKLPFWIYVSKKDSVMYTRTPDETAIDLENPLKGIPLPCYKKDGENNHFNVYTLKKQYC